MHTQFFPYFYPNLLEIQLVYSSLISFFPQAGAGAPRGSFSEIFLNFLSFVFDKLLDLNERLDLFSLSPNISLITCSIFFIAISILLVCLLIVRHCLISNRGKILKYLTNPVIIKYFKNLVLNLEEYNNLYLIASLILISLLGALIPLSCLY